MIAESILAAAILLTHGAPDGGVSARVVGSGGLVVGQSFELEVALDVEPSENTAIDFPAAPLDLGELLILSATDAGRTARRYFVVPAVSGRVEIPSLAIELRDGGGAVRSVRTAPLSVDVASSLDAQSRRFPDLVGDLELVTPDDSASRSWRIAIGIGAALVIAVAALLAGRARRRRPEAARRAAAVLPDRASLRARLDALDASLTADPGSAGGVALESAVLLREAIAIATRGAMPAPRRTTEEVSDWATSAARLETAAMDAADVSLVLATADLVKYGGARPDRAAAGSSLASARRAIATLLREPSSGLS